VRKWSTESKLAVGLGIWMIALGAYAFVLALSDLSYIARDYHQPIHIPIVFVVGVIITILGISLIRWGFRTSSIDDGIGRDSPKDRAIGWFISFAGLVLLGVCGILGFIETYWSGLLPEASMYLVVIMAFVSIILICFGAGRMKD